MLLLINVDIRIAIATTVAINKIYRGIVYNMKVFISIIVISYNLLELKILEKLPL